MELDNKNKLNRVVQYSDVWEWDLGTGYGRIGFNTRKKTDENDIIDYGYKED